MDIAIYGAGGQGRESASVALRSGLHPVMVSDDARQHGWLGGVQVVGIEDVEVECPVVVAIADIAARRRVVAKVEALGLRFGSLLSPTSVTLGSPVIGPGAVIGDFAVVSDARIGRHLHANVYTYIAHDCIIGDFVTFAPNVSCSGNVLIEDDVYVGAGAVLRQGTPDKPLRIGRGAVIGMGAVVTKDVPPGVVVVGNPARVMERG